MTQLNDLDDDSLLLVLDLLPPEELFKLQRCNRRLNQLATEKLRTKIKTILSHQISDDFFSSCTHLSAISQDQLLDLHPIWAKIPYSMRPSKISLLLSLLPKFGGVKSIDINCVDNNFLKLSGDHLLKMFRLCPELECLKLGDNIFQNVVTQKDEWDRLLDLNGDKLVHFAKASSLEESLSKEDWLLSVVAAKCPNIKRVDWVTKDCLTRDFVATLKVLPKSCWVTIRCYQTLEDVFEHVDELFAHSLDWSLFGDRVDRLSSLKGRVLTNTNQFHGVEFAGLKTLDLSECIGYHNESINCLIASQYPQLKEFSLEAIIYLSQYGYEALFRKMQSVEKLKIVWKTSLNYINPKHMPKWAIHQLKNLEIIVLDFNNSRSDWRPEDFLQPLRQYVDEIKSLKKLTVGMKYLESEWEKTVQEEVERLKVKQNRVEVEWVCKN